MDINFFERRIIMEKTRIGLPVGIMGALAFLLFLFAGYTPALLFAGYILICENDSRLRKTAVNALLLGLVFSALSTILGLLPQCGFSAAAANLFAGRVISIGTIVAVFLSTSDEMIPILVSGRVPALTVVLVVLYKALVGILVGLTVDLALKLMHRESESINIDAICDEDNCHCERGIWYSALHHTVTISLFVLAITLAINALVFFIGEENLGAVMNGKPVLSHIIATIFGLIPNCAASVALTTLCTQGLISAGTMMSGLFSGAGVGLLVLFRVNKKVKENLLILAIIVVAGIIFGLIGDLIFPASMFVK